MPEVRRSLVLIVSKICAAPIVSSIIALPVLSHSRAAACSTMRIGGTQPAAATRAGDDAFFLQARLACISVATVCFAAAAGLEGQKLGSPLIAALPGVAAAGALAYRARPALALIAADDARRRRGNPRGSR